MKFIFKFILAFILVVIIAVVFAGGGLVKYMVNFHSERLTGLKMTVAGAELSVLTGQLSLNNLAIANPAGYKNANAVTVESIQVNLQPKSLLKKNIKIDYIGVKGARVFFEGDMKHNNIQDIRKILEHKQLATAENKPHAWEKTPPKGYNPKHTFTIRQLQIQDTQTSFNLGIPGVKPASVPISDIELNNIGNNDNGASAKEVTDKILRPLFDNINKAAIEALTNPKGLLEKLKNSGVIKNIGDKLKGLF